MKTYIYIFAPPILITQLSGCGNLFLKMTSGKNADSSSFTLDSESVFNDFATRCGASVADYSDASKPFLELNLKSLPIVAKGKSSDIDYTVTVEARASISSQGGKSSQTVDASITSIKAESKGVTVTDAAIAKFIRPIAEDQLVKTKGNSIPSKSPSITTLLDQTRQEGPYKGIFCSVGFALSAGNDNGGERGEVTFDKPVPGAINPKAALSTYESELGESKSFNINVKIVTAKSDWQPVGQTIPVTVTVKKISTDLKQFPGLPADMQVPAIKSDAAYEISAKGPEGILVSSFGMTKRSAFFVDSSMKTFSAIVVESDQQTSNKMALPPIVLIPQ